MESPEVRRQLVGMLTAAGMSTRAIAPTVGVSQWTVRQDRDAGEREPLTSPAEPERIDPAVTYETTVDMVPEVRLPPSDALCLAHPIADALRPAYPMRPSGTHLVHSRSRASV